MASGTGATGTLREPLRGARRTGSCCIGRRGRRAAGGPRRAVAARADIGGDAVASGGRVATHRRLVARRRGATAGSGASPVGRRATSMHKAPEGGIAAGGHHIDITSVGAPGGGARPSIRGMAVVAWVRAGGMGKTAGRRVLPAGLHMAYWVASPPGIVGSGCCVVTKIPRYVCGRSCLSVGRSVTSRGRPYTSGGGADWSGVGVRSATREAGEGMSTSSTVVGGCITVDHHTRRGIICKGNEHANILGTGGQRGTASCFLGGDVASSPGAAGQQGFWRPC